MGKRSRRKKHIVDKNKEKLPPQRSILRKWFEKSWKVIVVLSVLLGIAVSFLALSPKISVSSTQTLDLSNPLATPFVITNEGLLPIHDVEVIFRIYRLYSTVTHNGIKNSTMYYGIITIPIIHSEEQTTVLFPPSAAIASPVDVGDVAIDVHYRPDFLLWHQHHFSRFKLMIDKEGKGHWYPALTK